MSFSALLGKMLVLLVFICIGVLCSKVHILDENASAALNKLVLYICGPVLILRSVQSIEIGGAGPFADGFGLSSVLMLFLYGAIVNVVSILVGYAASWAICGKKPVRGTFALVSGFANVVFMGIPVVSAMFGESGVFLLSIIAVPFNFFIFTIGIMIIPGGQKQRIPWKKLVVNPTLYAVVLALVLFFLQVKLPTPVTEIMDYLGQMVVPLSMILIGTALGRMTLREVFGNGLSYAVCAVKLLVMPLLLFFILRLFVKDQLLLGLLTVIAAMPSAAISPILSAEYGGDSAFASQSVFLTTLLSLATIPLVVLLLL